MLYPDAIGEACLIDEQGRELARVTEGTPAGEADLSTNEAENPFFAPTFALGPGQVYQAPPYVSPDTGRWVISNSTWVRLADGRRMIVHFEVSLDSFAPYVSTSTANGHVAVVDRDTGQVLLQDHIPLPDTGSEGHFPLAEWSTTFADVPASGTMSVEGHPAAYQVIDRAAGNATDWYVVEWSTARASFLPVGASLATTVGGVLLIALALLMLRRQQSTLRRATRLDHLTGLANRKALEEALDDALVDARSGGDPVAVLMVDLDGFKQVNDTLGHDKGDIVLREIARRLHANVFDYDTTARVGGDEFAVVVRHLREADDVAAVAHRLREALTRPIDIDGVPVSSGRASAPQCIPATVSRPRSCCGVPTRRCTAPSAIERVSACTTRAPSRGCPPWVSRQSCSRPSTTKS